MYKTRFLIVSNRKELSIKLKKIIENLSQEAIVTKDLSDALLNLQKQDIELIIISDTIKENIADFIKKIRVLTYNSRPIIIAISKSNDTEDRIHVLDSGADDFLGEEISKQEFQMRIKAHLRRYIESSVNTLTQLFDKKISIKALNKSVEMPDIAYILIKIQSLLSYKKTHGDIAYEKVLQTLGAIIKSMLSNNDFAGHIADDEIILITNSYQAEKISAFLAFAFDNISNKFYSYDQYSDNISINSDDTITETKDYLLRLYISVVEKRNEKDYRNIINSLYDLLKLCKDSPNSKYVIDRYRLKGEISKKESKVLIYEQDSALSYLLKNVCELNNIETYIAISREHFDEIYEKIRPSLVVLDWGCSNESNNLDLARKISSDGVKLIFSSSYLNKKEILKAGADLYLPKPYEINDMVEWIKKFITN